MEPENMTTVVKKTPLSLVDLCVAKAIDNIRYIQDVGETDEYLLEQILPHCAVDDLERIEKATRGRDLSPLTDMLWKKFYERRFGPENTKEVVAKMMQKKETIRRNKISVTWMQLYEAKKKIEDEKAEKFIERLEERYKEADARRQSRQIRVCTTVPPSSNKRKFYGGSRSGYNVSHLKSNLMKKAKIEVLNSREVLNRAAMKKSAAHRTNGVPSMIKQGGFLGKDSASTSQTNKPTRRFY